MIATLTIDTSRIDKKISSFTADLKSRFPNGIPERIDSELSRLSNDIILGDLSTAVGAGGTRKVIQAVDFGSYFDVFAAALRAGDFDIHNDPLMVG